MKIKLWLKKEANYFKTVMKHSTRFGLWEEYTGLHLWWGYCRITHDLADFNVTGDPWFPVETTSQVPLGFAARVPDRVS